MPAATDAPTVTVTVAEPPAVTEVGLTAAVGPDGDTLVVRLTVPAEPLVTAVLIVEVPLLPWAMLRLVGLALIEKLFVAGAVTLIVTVVLCTAVPSVPVTVAVYVPTATDAPTVTVAVEEPPAVTEVGLSETVGPAGETLAAKLTVPAEPLVTAVLIVDVALLPC